MWEMIMHELKPCPFCHSSNVKKNERDQVHCQNCNATAALEMWNKRPFEDELVAGALKMAANSYQEDKSTTKSSA